MRLKFPLDRYLPKQLNQFGQVRFRKPDTSFANIAIVVFLRDVNPPLTCNRQFRRAHVPHLNPVFMLGNYSNQTISQGAHRDTPITGYVMVNI